MDDLSLVTNIAKKLKFLDGDGRLKRLDSMSILDFVVELETALSLEIPTAILRQEVFDSLETVAAMLTEQREQQ